MLQDRCLPAAFGAQNDGDVKEFLGAGSLGLGIAKEGGFRGD